MVFWDDADTVDPMRLPAESVVDELRRLATGAGEPSTELVTGVRDAVARHAHTGPYRVLARLQRNGFDVTIGEVAAALLSIRRPS